MYAYMYTYICIYMIKIYLFVEWKLCMGDRLGHCYSSHSLLHTNDHSSPVMEGSKTGEEEIKQPHTVLWRIPERSSISRHIT